MDYGKTFDDVVRVADRYAVEHDDGTQYEG